MEFLKPSLAFWRSSLVSIKQPFKFFRNFEKTMVVVPLNSFGTMAFLNPMGIENEEITYKLLRDWDIFIHLSYTLTESISVPPSLYRRFYLVLNSTSHDLWFIEDVYHLVWWIKCLEYLGSENISQQDLVKIYPPTILSPDVV